MSQAGSEERIRELARELRPVRPIPRLRTVGGAALALFGIALAADRLSGGPGLRPWADPVWFQLSYGAILAGLACIALGFTTAALASAVPGREAVVRRGLVLGVLGVAAALGGGLWQLRVGDLTVGYAGFAADAACARRALQLGIGSGLLACAFSARAALRRPASSTPLALVGGVSLGALAVHTTCASDAAAHRLLAHILAPALAALVLALPLTALLERWAARSRSS